MAAVTSLPELIVGISSMRIVGSKFTPKEHHLFFKLSRIHVPIADFGIILLSLVGIGHVL
jgi:hypothetical protein